MPRRLLFILLLLCVAGSLPAMPPAVTEGRLACISHETNAKITAHVEGHPSSVRVYFHGVGDTCGEYYVDMRPSAQDPTLYSAILPIVSKDATAVSYQVRAQNASAKQVVGETINVPVTSNCVPPLPTPEDLKAAKGIALGLTEASQHAVPCHFKCNGVASVITASGELKPNEECRLVLAGLLKPWWATPAGAATAGASALAGGLALHAAANGRNNNPPSPARP